MKVTPPATWARWWRLTVRWSTAPVTEYTPWVGDVYYAAPDTYGVQAQPIYNEETGMAYGFGLGLTTAAMMDAWYNPVYYSPLLLRLPLLRFHQRQCLRPLGRHRDLRHPDLLQRLIGQDRRQIQRHL